MVLKEEPENEGVCGPRAPCLSIWNRVEIIYDERERAIDGLEIVPHNAVCHFALDQACTWNAPETKIKQRLWCVRAKACEYLLPLCHVKRNVAV